MCWAIQTNGHKHKASLTVTCCRASVCSFPGDCRKLQGVVLTVQFVAESAREQAKSQPGTLHEGWPKCLEVR
jgi:hypothetical protein